MYTSAPRDADEGMKAIYLDQWVWIQLARTRLGRPGTISTEIRDELVAKRLGGQATFPLSEVHYLETWKQGDLRRRSELAVEMGLLSGFRTLAPIRDLWPRELDQALRERFGRPESPGRPDAFGHGVAFAMGQPLPVEVAALDPERRFLLEWEVLRSPDDGIFAVERQQRIDSADRFAIQETSMSGELHRVGGSAQERAQRFRIQSLAALDVDLYGHLIGADITPAELGQLGGHGLEELVGEIPTLWVLTELRRLRHQNRAQGFVSSDLYDLRALAVAVVYCDVVIADKAWVHVLQISGLPERYGTVVSAKPAHAAKS